MILKTLSFLDFPWLSLGQDMPEKTANWNEGSQFTVLSACTILFHKNVTSEAILHLPFPIPRIPDRHHIEDQADRQQEFVK